MDARDIRRREGYLAVLLMLAASCSQCIPSSAGGHLVGTVVSLIQLVAYPGLVFLFGSLSRALCRTKEQTFRTAAVFAGLYTVEKLAMYWTMAILQETPTFTLLKTSNPSWLYLVLAEHLLLTCLLEGRRVNRTTAGIVAVAAGCFIGIPKFFVNELCFMRMVVFFPFFLLGRWLSRRTRDSLMDQKIFKAAGAFLLLLVSAYFWLETEFVSGLSTFFDGNKRFDLCSADFVVSYGPLARLIWYALTIYLVLGLLALLGDREIPFVTRASQSWYLAYVFLYPIAYCIRKRLMPDLFARFGVKKGLVIGLACAMVLFLLAFLPGMTGTAHRVFQSGLRTGRSRILYKESSATRSALLWYTGAFILVATALSLPFFTYGMSMVWTVDGLGQQYPIMAFTRSYLRDAVKDFLTSGDLTLNQYTFQAGLGMSVLDVLRKDPFLLLCPLVPLSKMENLYNILGVARLYVSGISVVLLCREMGQKRSYAMVCGGLSYAFCGYSLHILMRQPVFQTPAMIYLPLMLAGVERFLHKRKGGLFLTVVCLNFISGYYLAYMNTLLMALYLLIRLIYLHGKDVKTIVLEIVRLIGFYLWGMACALAMFLPSVWSLLNSTRGGERTGLTNLFLYPREYYEGIFGSLALAYPVERNYWAALSLPGMVFFAVVLLFLKKDKRFAPLKTGFLSCVVMLAMPLFGKIMNGFGYATNRWCYGLELMAALILVWLLPEIINSTKKEKLGMVSAAAVYIGMVLLRDFENTATHYVGLLLLALCGGVILMLELIQEERYRRAFVSLTAVMAVCLGVFTTFSPFVTDYGSAGVEAGTMNKKYKSEAVYRSFKDDSFYRIAQSATRSNRGLVMGFYGTTSYFSVCPDGLTNMIMDNTLNDGTHTFDLHGLDERAALNALTSTKYYVTKRNFAPYGFDWVREKDGYDVYENRYALPLGFAYDSYMRESDYLALELMEREQAVLQCAVVDDNADVSGLPEKAPKLTVQEIPCIVRYTEGVKLEYDEDEGTYYLEAKEDGASVVVGLNGLPGCDTYVYLEGLRYANPESNGASDVEVKSNGRTKVATLRGPTQTYYYENPGFSYNMGYSEESLRNFRVVFTEAGQFACDAFRVLCVPMEDYVTNVTALKTEVMENIVEDGDFITGTVDLSAERLMNFSIPYSAGWSLTVDGEKVPLIRTNRTFMGAVLPAGSHTLELRFRIPWLNYGLYVSAAAIASWVVFLIISAIVRKKKK